MTTSTIPAAAWRKSTYSNADGNCVEVAVGPSAVAVRDSKDCTGPVLKFSLKEWGSFIERLSSGQPDQL
jgi:hypothetical protein